VFLCFGGVGGAPPAHPPYSLFICVSPKILRLQTGDFTTNPEYKIDFPHITRGFT
jgi:hypothetical protein